MAVYEYGEKPEVTWGKAAALGVFVAAILSLGCFLWYETSVAKDVRQVFGTVESWQSHAKDTVLHPRRTASIRLDDGHLVNARADGNFVLLVGARAELTEFSTPTLGIKRYRVRSVTKAKPELPR